MRDPDVLRRQVSDLSDYFAAAWSDVDLARCEPHGSVVTTPRRGQTRATAAPFTDPVHAKVDRYPLHLRLYALVALRQLPWRLRYPIKLALLAGLPRRETARMLGCSPRTVQNRLRQALEQIARELWDAAGQQRLPRRNGRD